MSRSTQVSGLAPWEGTGSRQQVHLTGYMGCGKTAVGLRLARALVWSFLDLDVLVERHAGRKIAAIFESEGERAFRDLESFALRQAVQKPRAVLALGGGTLTVPGNLEVCRQAGLLVWLRCSPETLRRRLGGRRPERPLWQPDHLEEGLAVREMGYAQADVVVEADGSVDAVTAAVLRAVGVSG